LFSFTTAASNSGGGDLVWAYAAAWMTMKKSVMVRVIID
jgi:hypothetical protein